MRQAFRTQLTPRIQASEGRARTLTLPDPGICLSRSWNKFKMVMYLAEEAEAILKWLYKTNQSVFQPNQSAELIKVQRCPLYWEEKAVAE